MSTVPTSIQQLLTDLAAISGVSSVHISDTWSDGYFRILVTIGPDARDLLEFSTHAGAPRCQAWKIPELRSITTAVRQLISKANLHLEDLTPPKRIVEYITPRLRCPGDKPLSGYEDHRIEISVYT